MPKASLLAIGNYEDAHGYFSDLAGELGVEYLDFNLLRDAAYERSDSDYYDSAHLNWTGAQKFSHFLAAVLADPEAFAKTGALYPSFSEMEADMSSVAGVYCNIGRGEGTVRIAARAYAPKDLPVEYRISVREDDGGYRVLAEYSETSEVEFAPAQGVGYTVRVEARAKGSEEEFEQYYEAEVKA